MYSAISGGITAAAVGSRADSASFWALVCADEEWLRAEFDAIVSEPEEVKTRGGCRPVSTGLQRSQSGQVRCESGPIACAEDRPERRGARERSPPVGNEWIQ